jgi:hypothetical protein
MRKIFFSSFISVILQRYLSLFLHWQSALGRNKDKLKPNYNTIITGGYIPFSRRLPFSVWLGLDAYLK